MLLAGVGLFAGCNDAPEQPVPQDNQVETTGKVATDLAELPEAVVAVAMATRPDLTITEAEGEVRNGQQYYDVGGTLQNGDEIELDMTMIDGAWVVVEVQRDIDMAEMPVVVSELLGTTFPGWVPTRIIESTQNDGAIIYELFGPDGAGATLKQEIRWFEGDATLLTEEWVH
jgi:hypothetical protein